MRIKVLVNNSGTICWKLSDGRYHRDGDRPSAIFADGRIHYHKYNRLHREGGKPAMIYTDGRCYYYINGAYRPREDEEYLYKDIVGRHKKYVIYDECLDY